MNTPARTKKWFAGVAASGLLLLAVAACQHLAMMRNIPRPAESEFGLGPRASASGAYAATIETDQPLRTRRMQSVRLVVRDAAGNPVEGASIAIDGGMPEHGHGLPTRPRVTRELGGGAYAVDGIRFNMGGWWELEFAISTPAGPETITFNLDL